MEKYFIIYAQDLIKVDPDFILDPQDDTEEALLYFSWRENCKYPSVRVHRHDIDGGDYLPYSIDPEIFWTITYPLLVEANCFGQEG